MTAPTKDKTWEFGSLGANVNQAVGGSGGIPYDNADCMYKIKESLKSLSLTTPWTVWGSADGTALGFGNGDGIDRWQPDAPINTYTKIKWAAAGSNHSWIVLGQAGINGAQICIDLSNAASSSATLVFSPGGSFAAGTATARPTAGDQIILISDNVWGGSTAGFYTKGLHVMLSSDGQCTRVFLSRSDSSVGFWLFEKAKNPIAAWANPVFAGAVGNSGTTGQATYANFNDTARCQTKFGATTVTLFMTSAFYTDATVGENIIQPDDNTTEWAIHPIGLASTTAAHRGPRKGTVYDLWWGSTGVQAGKMYPDDGTKAFAQLGNFVMPWSGVSPPLLG